MVSFFGGSGRSQPRANFSAGDPFIGHEWTMGRKRPPTAGPAASAAPAASASFFKSSSPSKYTQRAAQEMHNPADSLLDTAANPVGTVANSTFLPASDVFMTKRFIQQKERVKVSIYHARDLVCHTGACEPYVTLQIPGNPKSRLNTPVDYQHGINPVWNFVDKQVFGWASNKALQFDVKNKAAKDGGALATMIACAEDQVLGSVTLMPDQYWPYGFKEDVSLTDQYGNEAGRLWIEVEPIGGPKPSRWCCSFACDACAAGCGAFAEELRNIPKHVEETLTTLHDFMWKMLDPPYLDRKPSERNVLMIVPTMIFLLMLFLVCMVYFASHIAVAFIGAIIGLVAIAIIVYSCVYRKAADGFPYSTLGCLCLLAVVLGTLAGAYAWNFSWQQWWWLHTGQPYGGMQASTPAAARVDASSVSFSDAPALTSVDASRAAGYRNGDIYCAAPILDPNATLADHIRVNYWAIGINCCDDFGSFTCDSARELSGNVGVVMVGNGMPCAGCYHEYFELAALKANGIYSMVSSPAALYVRYVRSSAVINREYWIRGIFILLMLSIGGCLLFAALGFVADYKGLGKPPRTQVRDTKVVKRPAAPPEKSCLDSTGLIDKPPRFC